MVAKYARATTDYHTAAAQHVSDVHGVSRGEVCHLVCALTLGAVGGVHGERRLLILLLVTNLGVCPALALLSLVQPMEQMVCVRQLQCSRAQKSSWQILLAGKHALAAWGREGGLWCVLATLNL